jgi:hypothetical protein
MPVTMLYDRLNTEEQAANHRKASAGYYKRYFDSFTKFRLF